MNRIVLICLFIIFSASQCKDDLDCRLHFANNSEDKLWVDVVCREMPDSVIWIDDCFGTSIDPLTNKECCDQLTWEEVLFGNDNTYVTIYISNFDTAQYYDAITLIEEIKYLDVRIISLSDLENLDWTISYP